jgi:hypothetical protein
VNFAELIRTLQNSHTVVPAAPHGGIAANESRFGWCFQWLVDLTRLDGDATMTLFNRKLFLSAVGIALLATPAYAHKPLHHKQHVAAHASQHRQYVQRYADPPRYFLMATDSPAPSSYGSDNYYYPGDY